MRIEACGIARSFGAVRALDAIDLRVEPGELVAILGPSGSGKTTLLRIVAGLERPDAGRLLFDGEDVTAWGVQARRAGFVFQHLALFRHMTAFENVAFGLRVLPRARRPSRAAIHRRVGELLALVQLEDCADRRPAQLSGGQRQRVALARTLAVEPRLLLLDEPFGALDAKVRKELRRCVRHLHQSLGITSILVTHDQEEALDLAHRVVIMRDGRVEQVGAPEEIYSRPANAFVYEFLGDVNLLDADLQGDRALVGSASVPCGPVPAGRPGRAALYVRPHALALEHTRVNGHQFAARVLHINAAGPTVKVELRAEWGALLRADLSRERFRELALAVGSDVFVTPRESALFARGADLPARRCGPDAPVRY